MSSLIGTPIVDNEGTSQVKLKQHRGLAVLKVTLLPNKHRNPGCVFARSGTTYQNLVAGASEVIRP